MGFLVSSRIIWLKLISLFHQSGVRLIVFRIAQQRSAIDQLSSTVVTLATARTVALERNYSQVTELVRRVDDLSAQVTRLSSSASANASNLDLNSLAHEVQDRVSRATNVIFYGVPEIPPGTPNTDIAEIAGIRHALSGIGGLFLPDSVPHRRLPHAASVNGTRRLLIRIGSVDMVSRLDANYKID